MTAYSVQSKDCILQAYGKGNPNSDIMILLLHGGPGSGAQPIMELSAFQHLEQVYRCIYFDQRGSGISFYELKKGILKEDLIEDVHQMVLDCRKRFSQRKLYLWGGSFGGLLAALYIEQYPDEVDGLILSSPAFTYTREQSLIMFTHLKEEIKQRVNDPLEELTIYCKEQEPELFFQNAMVKELISSKQNPSNSLRHIAAMANWFFQLSFQTTLQNIQLATLILLGEDDPICPAQPTIEVLETIHNEMITCKCFSSCGHSIFLDQEEQFVSQIIQFIQETSTS